MPYSSLFLPRPKVLSAEGVESIIDLANLSDARRLEARPAEFLALTYPTSDMRQVVTALGRGRSQHGAKLALIFAKPTLDLSKPANSIKSQVAN